MVSRPTSSGQHGVDPAVLSAAYADMVTQDQRADAKASALLSLLSAVVAAVLAVAAAVALPVAVAVTVWVSGAALLAALVVLLLLVRPFVDRTPADTFARLGAVGVREALAGHTCESWHTDRIAATARSARRKYRAIRATVSLLLLGVAGLVLAAVLFGVLTPGVSR